MTISNVIVHKVWQAKHANIMIFALPIHAKIMGLVRMISSRRGSNVNVKISLKVNLAPCHVSSVSTLLLTLLTSGSEWPFDQALVLKHSRYARKLYDHKIKIIFEISQVHFEIIQ